MVISRASLTTGGHNFSRVELSYDHSFPPLTGEVINYTVSDAASLLALVAEDQTLQTPVRVEDQCTLFVRVFDGKRLRYFFWTSITPDQGGAASS